MNRYLILALDCALALGLVLPVEALQDSASQQRRRVGSPVDATQSGELERVGEAFGSAIATLGDLDGNGSTDVVVGAPDAQAGGAIWIFLTKPDGSTLRTLRIQAGQAGFRGPLNPAARFGTSLASLGDLDGDGILELAVGAPGTRGSMASGVVWILSINARAEVVAQRELRLRDGPTLGASDQKQFAAEAPGAREGARLNAPPPTKLEASPALGARSAGFGTSLATIGDLNGDGHVDLAVGAPFDDDGGASRGAVWILGLGKHGERLTQQKISSTQGYFRGALSDWDRFGYALANVGDLDGDGRAELAIGAPGTPGAQTRGRHPEGAAWILFLAKQGGVRRQRRIEAPTHGDPLASEELGLRFGSSLCSLGDLDGDGCWDLAVGAPLAGKENKGVVWMLLLRPDGSVMAHQKLGAQDPGFAHSLQPGAGLGKALALINHPSLGGKPTARPMLWVSTALDEVSAGQDGALWQMPLEGCFAASVSMREGSGRNPRILTTSGPPRRGNPWQLYLDCSQDSLGNGVLLGRTRASHGIFTEAGEVLVDLSPSCFAFILQAPHQGNEIQFSLPIPADSASCNMALYLQGVCTTGRSMRFSNALDVIVGR